jgi:serine/threonine-protein kinase
MAMLTTMSLPASIGHYKVTAKLGEGGMGAVYRATDTRLHRDVAIKILPPAFAQDSGRMQRFEREAQVLASLNHPNIAAIYGVEQGAIVMELVEGENLKGPVPAETAVDYARQIASGLEAAHEKGVVHRDLKPANIRVTPDGVVKLLDFGLAKAAEPAGPDRGESPTMSPTLSLEMSKAGMILGTAAYMSPEQARGKAVDKRADIWAFGVVLYEMLAGKALFASGETLADTIAAVMTREPDWSALPKHTPPHVLRLLQRCLCKDAKNRLRDIGDARIALDDEGDVTAEGAPQMPRNRLRRALPWALLAAATAVFAAWAPWHRGDGTRREVMHLDIGYPPNVDPVSGLQAGFAVSPDGHSLTLIGVRDGVRRLYVRRLDRAETAEINDTTGVNAAVFSPDSASVVFYPLTGSVTRLSLADRQRAIVATGADVISTFAWAPGVIVYTRGGALWAVPAEGGTPRQLTVLDPARHEVVHTEAAVFPGTRTVLFTSLTTDSGAQRIESVPLDGGRRSVVIEHAMAPVWSPTGHLLFGRDGAVWAAPFDPGSATVRGAAVPVIAAGVVGTNFFGSPAFQVSSTGTLVFIPADFAYKRVVSVARDGSELALNLPPNSYGNPRISPDGRRLLMETNLSAIETLDVTRGTRAKLAASALGTSYSIWTVDGKGVVFRRYNVPFWAAADGSGQLGPVPSGTVNDFPSSAGPDADSILDVRIQPETSGDVFLMSISGKFQPKPLLVTPAYEGGAQLSPDGRWMVYQSSESGQPEIYVRRYPALDRAWQVSEGGGTQARWSRTSREIYYRGGKHMMAVTFDASRVEPVFGKPVALFNDEYDSGVNVSVANYDVTRDGRFVMLRLGARGAGLRAVIGWTEELKHVLAASGAR